MQIQTPLAVVWPQIIQLLDIGYSIIPVRDKQEGDKAPKTPYGGWKKYQTQQITKQELWQLMSERYNTTAIAVICGKISGNLELIDIDNKNYPGIESKLFSDIEKILPNVWQNLRIHKTPSGGYHIIYSVPEKPVPGNTKLASRLNDNGKPVAFIETRGEGGYFLLPPSMGYSIYKDRPVTALTWADRCSLIAICNSYDQIKKNEPTTITTNKGHVDDYYDVNPFEDFNKSTQAEKILDQYGWKYKNHSAEFIWYTRPDTQSSNIHAAFLRDKRLYYFFTTNSQFDPDQCYQPATVLSKLAHGDDKKQTYKYLVEKGYGKIKKSVEDRIVERNSIAGIPAPPNLSSEAIARLEAATLEVRTTYPFGIFWDVEEGGIDRESVYRVSNGLGFRYDIVTGNLTRIIEGFIEVVSERYYFDVIKNYMKAVPDDIKSQYESFLQKSGSFSIKRLELLNEQDILKDSRDYCWKFYSDCYIRISKEGWAKFNYPNVDGKLIWRDQIQYREFKISEGGEYKDFLNKAIEYEQQLEYIELVIGFLAHNYKDETTAYIPVFVEQCEDPRHGGGSGKNLFCNLFKLCTTVASTPGAQFKTDDSMLQAWHGERLFVISDVRQDFDFGFLKDLVSGEGRVKKLYSNISTIPVDRMPKIIVLTNYSYEVEDGGLKRRIAPVEFTDFFTKAGGVDVHYGKFFPNDWSEEDYAGYDFIILRSVQRWLNHLKIPNERKLTEGGWRKQFEQEFGRTIVGFIHEHWDNWILSKVVTNEDFKKQLDQYYIDNNINRNYQPSMYKINRGVEVYASHYEIEYRFDVKRQMNNIQFKCKTFIHKNDVAPF